jgi:sugar phosphate isomerase/epimerase
MEKILNLGGLGTGGRQNEMIELALTHKFDSIEIDMADVLARFEAMGRQFALQLLKSAHVKVGTFRLPIDFGGTNEQFEKELGKLDKVIDLAKELKCTRCYYEVESGSDEHSFQENFENHRTRINSVGAKMADANFRLGLSLSPAVNQPAKQTKFLRTAEECLTLVRLVGNKNVGLCLNTWAWTLCNGGLEQVASLAADRITEVRMADVPEGFDPATTTTAQIQLPGSAENSMVPDLMRHLHKIGYDGAVSVASNTAMFSGKSRETVVAQISRRLDQLIELGNGSRQQLDEFETPQLEMAAAGVV